MLSLCTFNNDLKGLMPVLPARSQWINCLKNSAGSLYSTIILSKFSKKTVRKRAFTVLLYVTSTFLVSILL
jgi:hypothetical protein